MTYKDFLATIDGYYQKIGLEKWPAAPSFHDGFPGNFNLSLSEYEFLNQNEDFFNLKKDMVYVKNQPCIRHNDFSHIDNPNGDSYRYLLRFTMAPVGGIVWKKDISLKEKETKKAIFNLLNFLTNECNLDKNKIYIQYLKSDKIKVLTEGKYDFNCQIPNDPNLKYYLDFGIPKNNFIPISNRDGLLALNVYGRPTPWGYRNEIFYDYNGKLLDIATFDSLVFQPILDQQNKIINLKLYPYTLVVGAIGVERLLMILNGFKDINDIDLINEPAVVLRPYTDPRSAKQLVQTLRAIQLIIADGGWYKNLGKRRREKMRDFYKFIQKITENNKIPVEVLGKVLVQVADLEPNLPQLEKAIDDTILEYERHKLRMKYIHSWQEHLDELPKNQLF